MSLGPSDVCPDLSMSSTLGILFVEDDRRVYVEVPAEQAERYGLEIVGYCLMDDLVHCGAI